MHINICFKESPMINDLWVLVAGTVMRPTFFFNFWEESGVEPGCMSVCGTYNDNLFILINHIGIVHPIILAVNILLFL